MFKPFLKAAGLSAALAVGLTATAQAQDTYPQRAVTLIVPFLAGGGGDTLARLTAEPLARELKTTIIVENRPGAGGNIGAAQMVRSTPDGYTLGYGTNGTSAINHWLYKNPGYKPSDLEPISRLTTIAATMVVRPDMNIKSAKELIAYGEQHPGELTCGSAGNGTTSHIACELFKQMTGLDILHIPYKGGAAALTDLIGGRINILIDVMPNLAGQIKAGNVVPLAVTTQERVDSHPDIPTLDESGVPGYYFFAWDALYAPKGTPDAILDRLNEAVHAMMADPEVAKRFTDRGATPAATSREELGAFVQEEYERLGEIVKNAGVSID
ncbi:MAG: tripartite tricarboxylate transporter substrate binding protein [Pusillimonas sp.]